MHVIERIDRKIYTRNVLNLYNKSNRHVINDHNFYLTNKRQITGQKHKQHALIVHMQTQFALKLIFLRDNRNPFWFSCSYFQYKHLWGITDSTYPEASNTKMKHTMVTRDAKQCILMFEWEKDEDSVMRHFRMSYLQFNLLYFNWNHWTKMNRWKRMLENGRNDSRKKYYSMLLFLQKDFSPVILDYYWTKLTQLRENLQFWRCNYAKRPSKHLENTWNWSW